MEDPPDTTCPECSKRGPWSNAEFRPFCSRRCKQVGLGKWFAGEYRFSEALRPSHFGEELKGLDDTGPEDRDSP